MKLHEIVDSLIELSTHEMPDEARKSLDDAIDHIVSSMMNKSYKVFFISLCSEDMNRVIVLNH